MRKFLGLSLVVAGLVSGVFGVDYSKMSNEELIAQSGKFDPKETLDYFKEVFKRTEKMSEAQIREFRFKLSEERIKAEENMLVKDYRARKKAICAEFQKEFANIKPSKALRSIAKSYCKAEGKRGEGKRGEGKCQGKGKARDRGACGQSCNQKAH